MLTLSTLINNQPNQTLLLHLHHQDQVDQVDHHLHLHHHQEVYYSTCHGSMVVLEHQLGNNHQDQPVLKEVQQLALMVQLLSKAAKSLMDLHALPSIKLQVLLTLELLKQETPPLPLTMEVEYSKSEVSFLSEIIYTLNVYIIK